MRQIKNKIYSGEILKKLRSTFNITCEKLASATSINLKAITTYEQTSNYNEISLKNLIKLSKYFQTSIDFILLWDNCHYVRNINLLSLAEKIDKMEQTERYQIESTAKSLMGKKKSRQVGIHLDEIDFSLTDNIHENIKILFANNKEITSKQTAEELNVDPSMISSYRTRTKPPAEKMIKLSQIFDISIHAMATGEKLYYNFENKGLKEAILKADQLLSLEDQKFLIKLMENIVNQKPQF